MFVPEGYTTLFPYLVVDEALAYLDFLRDGLGGVEIGRTIAPDGRLANARVRFGTTTIMVSGATPSHPARRTSLYLYVAEAEAAMARALAAGGRQVMAVADMPYGDRQGGIEDPSSTVWWLSQRLIDAPYDP